MADTEADATPKGPTPDELEEKYDLSRQELQRVIESIPANVFFKDTQGRYVIASHTCQMISGGDEGFTLIGKTDLDIQPDHELGQRYLDEDLEVAETGKRFSYTQEMVFSGESYYYEISKSPVYDDDGRIIGVTGFVNDMTEATRLGKELYEYSVTDSMTQAYNRSYYERHPQEFAPADLPVSVVMADCDNLKYLNDTFGHDQGDYLITSTVANIRRHTGRSAEIIRMGGDEFLMLIPACDEARCRSLLTAIKADEAHVHVQDTTLSTSYGFVVVDDVAISLEDAVRLADRSMYEDKRRRAQQHLFKDLRDGI
jgi:diguanylate cyclase (GGDEF)-like protein/PAS domain S-box-containing protein